MLSRFGDAGVHSIPRALVPFTVLSAILDSPAITGFKVVPAHETKSNRPSLLWVLFYECKTLTQKHPRRSLKLESITLKFGHILEVILMGIFCF